MTLALTPIQPGIFQMTANDMTHVVTPFEAGFGDAANSIRAVA